MILLVWFAAMALALGAVAYLCVTVVIVRDMRWSHDLTGLGGAVMTGVFTLGFALASLALFVVPPGHG